MFWGNPLKTKPCLGAQGEDWALCHQGSVGVYKAYTNASHFWGGFCKHLICEPSAKVVAQMHFISIGIRVSDPKMCVSI